MISPYASAGDVDAELEILLGAVFVTRLVRIFWDIELIEAVLDLVQAEDRRWLHGGEGSRSRRW